MDSEKLINPIPMEIAKRNLIVPHGGKNQLIHLINDFILGESAHSYDDFDVKIKYPLNELSLKEIEDVIRIYSKADYMVVLSMSKHDYTIELTW